MPLIVPENPMFSALSEDAEARLGEPQQRWKFKRFYYFIRVIRALRG